MVLSILPPLFCTQVMKSLGSVTIIDQPSNGTDRKSRHTGRQTGKQTANEQCHKKTCLRGFQPVDSNRPDQLMRLPVAKVLKFRL